ncbi:hypothetical protein Scep_009239 [Stephania cephalantha]|uniref:S1 motif domain-containing protein n=1 Tax=Stephania cephalantha TaxID=152367 RepID=A0AAP0JSS4_9MAGN
MKELQVSLNQTQKIRLQTALQKLQDLSSKVDHSIVAVADTISVNHEDGFLKGHGTFELGGEVVATVCGVVERVNKLVYVRALRPRYQAERGDIIVGRVVEIVPERWKVEINFSQDAVLMLSSMNMPDGIQRRRTANDELNMRTIFEENDIICAEVRDTFQQDGTLHLQARSRKYGKLEKGQLLTVSPYLVKRSKQHFHHLEEFGIDLILGSNGYIWIGEHVEARDNQENPSNQQNDTSNGRYVNLAVPEKTYTALEKRQQICRIANAIRVLSSLGFNMTKEIIMEIVNLSITLNVEIHEMLGAEFYVRVAEKEVERRSSLKMGRG